MLNLDVRGQGLWAFPRPVKYMPRPCGQLTNAELVEALVADAQRAAAKSTPCECEFSDSGLRTDVCACCLQMAVAS